MDGEETFSVSFKPPRPGKNEDLNMKIFFIFGFKLKHIIISNCYPVEVVDIFIFIDFKIDSY